MKTDLPFRSLDPAPERTELRVDGAPVSVIAGANLAAALLEAGVLQLRAHPVSGAARAPFCMMGTCFECLVDIGGVRRQACMLTVEEGMEIRRIGMTGPDDAV